MKKEYDVLSKADKVIMAYSGGLDTSVLVHWLKAQGVKDVICVSGDYGQVKDVDALEKKAIASGASKFYCFDLREEFLTDYAFPTLQAGAKYEGVYLLGTAIARPSIAKKLVEVAQEEGAHVIVHGCTGKGNDQVRFELSMLSLDENIEVIAPWRFWEIKGRQEEIQYCIDNNIPITATPEDDYSEDENNWHISHEGMDLESLEHEANLDRMLTWANKPEDAPDEPAYVTIDFDNGVPVAVDGEELAPVALMDKLNALGAQHAIGIDDIVESRLVGMKSRGVYENPGAAILYFAHNKLESICLDADTLHFKQVLALKYGELVYNGKWFTPLREALNAFVQSTQEVMTGQVTVKLYKGGTYFAGAKSPYTLYSEDYATFESDEVYNQEDATGFINLYGLSSKIAAHAKRVGDSGKVVKLAAEKEHIKKWLD